MIEVLNTLERGCSQQRHKKKAKTRNSKRLSFCFKVTFF